MEPFSFVHASDLHIDSPFRGVTAQSPHIAAQLQEATARSYQNIIDLCISRKVDFLVIAGDIYDSADRQIQSQLTFLDGLKRLAEHNIQSFIVHGNHDPLRGWCASLNFEAARAHIFPVRPEAFLAERNGIPLANVVGMSYAEAREERNVVGDYKRISQNLDLNLFKIGILHSNVGNIAGHLNYAPCSVDDLKNAGFDYWALGHVHERNQLCDNPRIAYPGNSQGRHIREKGPRGALVVSVDRNKNSTSEFVATDCVRWEAVAIDIAGHQTIDTLDNTLEKALNKLLAQSDGRAVVCRVELTGRGVLYEKLKAENARDDLLARCRGKFSRRTPFLWLEQLDFKCSPQINFDEAIDREDLLAFVLRESAQIRDQNLQSEFADDLKSLLEHKLIGNDIFQLETDELEACLLAAETICVDLLESN